MSLLRRWFDPIRSSWFYQKPVRQTVLSIEDGLSIHLRLDDVYSYLAVQQLPQLEEILSPELKPLKVIISDQRAEPPNQMSFDEWQHYCLNDAKILSKQHRFSFHETPELPTAEALKQAETILRNTPLRGQDFLYLLEDVFHMLWQNRTENYALYMRWPAVIIRRRIFRNEFLSIVRFWPAISSLADASIRQ